MKARKQINPVDGIMKTMNVLESRDNSFRKDAFTDEFNSITVDTCKAFDTDTWETGIKRGSNRWVIVEQYDDRDGAIKGHKKWVKLLKKNPKKTLQDINVWG